jgi:adsorption protein B
METLLTAVLAILLVAYLTSSADDVLLDLIYLVKHKQFRSSNLDIKAIETDSPKRTAVMIPAWREAGVVADMIRSTLELTHYPKALLEFFVGVYPNDEATRKEVEQLARDNPNVHCVVNPRPGPTNKSQNLNAVYTAIKVEERERGIPFQVVVIHDAEDVIHPYSFKLYSALLNTHEAVQLPVIALFPRFRWRSLLGFLISGTYADEFAENHMHHVPVREFLHMFVPSAGTGFALRREVLERLAEEGNIFNEQSLTEDYELSLRMYKLGIRVHFHLQRVPRITSDGRTITEIVAVKEHFPNAFNAAIKQKGRWTYGITLQTPRLVKTRFSAFRDRFALWRDRKGRYANLVHLLGYPMGLYAVLEILQGLRLPHADPQLLLYIGLPVLGITLERLTMRFLSIQEIYGLRQAMLGTFVLPLFPLRWLIGNIINAFATLRAWRLYYRPGAGARKGTAPKWDKTERKSYVAREVLDSNRRRLGDALLFHDELPTRTLARIIRYPNEHKRLGELLLENGSINQTTLYQCLAETRDIPYVRLTADVIDGTLLPLNLALELGIAPLAAHENKLFAATPAAFEPARLERIQHDLRQATHQTLLPLATDTSVIENLPDWFWQTAADKPPQRFDSYLASKGLLPLEVFAYTINRLHGKCKLRDFFVLSAYLPRHELHDQMRQYSQIMRTPGLSTASSLMTADN